VIGPKRQKLTARQERDAYDAVTTRDQGRCVRCGHVGPVERDHRQNRDPFNTVPSNLQLLGGDLGCGCHRFKTEHPAVALREGFAVPRWADWSFWPAWRADVASWVIYFDAPDSRGRWWDEITAATSSLLTHGEVG